MRITRFTHWTFSESRRIAAVRRTSKGPTRFLTAGLLTILLAGLPAQAATTSFTFNITGSASSSTGANGVDNYKDDGAGPVPPFGNAIFVTTGTLTQNSASTAVANGSFTFTFPNGDSFQGTYGGITLTFQGGGGGSGGANTQGTGPATITGGTGTFANASGSMTITFSGSGSSFTLTGSGSITSQTPGLPPAVFANGTVNNASFATGTNPVAPGTIAAIFGTNLDDGTSNPFSSFGSNGKLLTTLGGASVTFNGISAPIFSSFPGQLNVQIPLELGGAPSASVVVTVGGQASTPQTVPLGPNSPGIFTVPPGGTGQGAIQIANTTIFAAAAGSISGAQTRAANPGEFLTIYCTGLGDVSTPPQTGMAASGNPLSATVTTPQVTIGGIPATVSFAGLSPGFVGLYQVNAQIPTGAPSGNAITVVLSIGGKQSNTVTIAVAGSGGGGGGNNPVVLQGSATSVTGTLPGTLILDSTATGSISISATGVSSGGQTVYSASGTGNGTVSCLGFNGSNSNSNWTASLSATVTVSPAITSLVTSGGSVSGNFSYSIILNGCGGSSTNAGSGTVTGTVNHGGAVTLILTGSGGGGGGGGGGR